MVGVDDPRAGRQQLALGQQWLDARLVTDQHEANIRMSDARQLGAGKHHVGRTVAAHRVQRDGQSRCFLPVHSPMPGAAGLDRIGLASMRTAA